MISQKAAIVCSVIFLLGLVVGLVIPIDILPPKIVTFKEQRNRQSFRFINPLLDCESADLSRDRNLDPLKNKIDHLISSEIDQKDIEFASVYYRDLDNGPWFGINQDELFSPSSLIKVPLMIAYFKLAQEDPALLQKQLTNTEIFDPKNQNIQPQQHLEVNQSYTVDDLIYRMIVYSDNLAYDLLLNNIDNNLVYKVYSDMGIDISAAATDPNGNIISVKSYASFFRMLFNSSYLDNDMSEKALKILSNSQFKDGLIAGVPDGVAIAHKFGERQYLATGQKQLHDCGIVYPASARPYLICVMTRGQDFTKMEDSIKEISASVYNEVGR
ncbi:MAG TPA: serine hydrolase [Patescibacteria group bacterium]